MSQYREDVVEEQVTDADMTATSGLELGVTGYQCRGGYTLRGC